VPKPSYHHGELRQTVLSIARNFNEDGGVEKIKMRSIADQAGVTPMAIYKHFANKNDLVNALATEGFNELAQRVSNAKSMTELAPTEQLRAMLISYFEHGSKNPRLYDLMFNPSILESLDEDLMLASKNAFSLLYNCLKDNADYFCLEDTQCLEYARLIWAMCHGVTALFAGDHAITKNINVESAELIVRGLCDHQGNI